MKLPISLFLLALATLVLPVAAQAQAWTRDRGSFYLDLNLGFTTGTSIYRPDFSRQELPTRFSQAIVGLYGEVGIIDRWLTTSVSTELLRFNQLDDQGRTLGLGDSRVGFWSGIVTEPFRLTAGVVVGVPTGDPEPDAGGGADADAVVVARSLPTGDGEWDVEPQLVFGHSFSPRGWLLNHYVQTAVGYHWRTSGSSLGVEAEFADAFTYRLEVGAQPRASGWDRLWLTLRFFGVESFASDTEAAAGAVGLGNGVTYTAYAVRLYARLVGGLGVAASYEGAVRARSIVAAPVFRLALSYEQNEPE